jgi:hypothetical protein
MLHANLLIGRRLKDEFCGNGHREWDAAVKLKCVIGMVEAMRDIPSALSMSNSGRDFGRKSVFDAISYEIIGFTPKKSSRFL